MTGTSADTDRPRRRWLTGLLAVSLALNLVAGGVAAGIWLRADAARETRFVERMLRNVPEPHRDAARAALSAEPEARQARMRDVMAASEEVLAAFRADPVDGKALDRALAARLAAVSARMEARHDRVRALAEALPAEARATFAEAIAERIARRRARLEAPASRP